ncbi:MAG: family 10 glycosylhydrolase [Clostridiales bacterium]|nr:family 10 glycosylhydrolase [Clostridiales bacterium]
MSYGWTYLSKLLATILSITVLIPTMFFSVPGCSRQPIDTTDSTTTSKTETTTSPPDTPTLMTEVRGVWIASVINIDFPSKPGLSASQLRAELDDIIATTLSANLNAIYFQVRPTGDALYKSDIFPTSAYLTGTQGAPLNGGFDPLEYLLEKAHEKGLKVHAWVNPLRVTSGSASKPNTDVTKLAANNPARKNPSWVIPYDNGMLYYDAGIPEVRKLIADGCAEIVSKYDVDGIVFDDYFYPYPTTISVGGQSVVAPFNDNHTFAKYASPNQKLDDWRRENINKMVEDCYKTIKDINPNCQFGIAPFGIWQNNDGKNGGSDTNGLSSYSAIYCDPIAWIRGGYIDYIAPQIYWQFSTEVARYDVLTRWWNEKVQGTNVDLLICHGVYRYDEWKNPSGEITNQIEFARDQNNYRGSIMYGYKQIKANKFGLTDELKAAYKDIIYYPTSNKQT